MFNIDFLLSIVKNKFFIVAIEILLFILFLKIVNIIIDRFSERVKKYNDDIDCYIFVADEMESISNALDRVNILIAKDVLDIELRKWYDMAFKYDLTASLSKMYLNVWSS